MSINCVDKETVKPFGSWLAEKPRHEPLPPVGDWTWAPKGDINRLGEGATIGGTTGTGPDAKSDEVRDES